jgi:hypothetical protein
MGHVAQRVGRAVLWLQPEPLWLPFSNPASLLVRLQSLQRPAEAQPPERSDRLLPSPRATNQQCIDVPVPALLYLCCKPFWCRLGACGVSMLHLVTHHQVTPTTMSQPGRGYERSESDLKWHATRTRPRTVRMRWNPSQQVRGTPVRQFSITKWVSGMCRDARRPPDGIMHTRSCWIVRLAAQWHPPVSSRRGQELLCFIQPFVWTAALREPNQEAPKVLRRFEQFLSVRHLPRQLTRFAVLLLLLCSLHGMLHGA